MEKFSAFGARASILGSVVMAGLIGGFLVPASAEPADPAGDAITGLGTTVSTYGAAMVAVVVVAVGFVLGIKYLRKAVSKA